MPINTLTSAVVVTLLGVLSSFAYNLHLDTQKDTKFWKFRGNYIYAHSLANGGRLAPQLRTNRSEPPTKGVWYFKNAAQSEDNDNYFEISYSLRHALFQQVWVRLVAHPSTVISLQNSERQELGSFKSSGQSWCDVVVNARLTPTVRVTVNLTEPGTYVMIDKIVLGIMSPINGLNLEDKNPCSSSVDNSTQHTLAPN